MSAMFAFEVGDVSMRSLTFERVIREVLARSDNPTDQQVCKDALDLNCLWIDQIPAARLCPMVANLHNVLQKSLRDGSYVNNQVAVFEINNVMAELASRYPHCFAN